MRSLILIFSLLLSASWQASADLDQCEFKNLELLRYWSDGGEDHRSFRFELIGDAAGTSFSTLSQTYNDYQRSYFEWLDQPQVGERLDRYCNVYTKLFENAGDERRRSELRPAMHNVCSVASGRVGVFGAANCLESLLFARHLSRVKDAFAFVESSWSVLRGKTDWVVIESASQSAGIVGAGTHDEREWFLARGYQLVLHLHNHPPGGEISGADSKLRGPNLVPSPTDVILYRRLSVPRAVVTDGVFSLRFDKTDVGQLVGRP